MQSRPKGGKWQVAVLPASSSEHWDWPFLLAESDVTDCKQSSQSFPQLQEAHAVDLYHGGRRAHCNASLHLASGCRRFAWTRRSWGDCAEEVFIGIEFKVSNRQDGRKFSVTSERSPAPAFVTLIRYSTSALDNVNQSVCTFIKWHMDKMVMLPFLSLRLFPWKPPEPNKSCQSFKKLALAQRCEFL